MTIGQKIFALASVFSFALVGIGAYGLSHMSRLAEDVHAVSVQSTTLTEASSTLHGVATGQLRQMIQFERALSAATGRGHGEAHEKAYQFARSEFDRIEGEVSQTIEQGEAEIQAALLRPLPADERARLAELRERLTGVAQEHRTFTDEAGAVFSLIDDGAISQAVAEAARIGAGAITFDYELSGLIADVRARTGERLEEASRGLAEGRAGLLVLVAFGAVASLIGWALMGRSIAAPLFEFGRVAEAVAAGKRGFEMPKAVDGASRRLFEALALMTSNVEAAEAQTIARERDLNGALARVAEQNRRLHALERELAELRRQAPATGGPSAREIVGPQRRSDT